MARISAVKGSYVLFFGKHERVMGKLYLGFSFSSGEGNALSLPLSLGYCHWEVPSSKTSKNTWVLLRVLQSVVSVRCWERTGVCRRKDVLCAKIKVDARQM